ncbi:MAG: hypothetical protein M5T61_19670, partial [Acidimicrobiia bacterium]|nr:hypothetical protein [Acidimicrobiia bacterium]
EAIDLADRGDFDSAAGRIESTHALLSQVSPSADRAEDFAEETELLFGHAQAMREQRYSPIQRKRMRMEEMKRRKGR